MDIRDTHRVVAEAIARVREERRPILIEAVTYRFRGHSMADPEQYRSKEEVARWRERDPLGVYGDLLVGEGKITAGEIERLDAAAVARVDAAVEFAEASPFPEPAALYDDIYVLGESSRGWYSVETAGDRAETGRPEETAGVDDEIPQQLTSALAAGEDGHEPGGRTL